MPSPSSGAIVHYLCMICLWKFIWCKNTNLTFSIIWNCFSIAWETSLQDYPLCAERKRNDLLQNASSSCMKLLCGQFAPRPEISVRSAHALSHLTLGFCWISFSLYVYFINVSIQDLSQSYCVIYRLLIGWLLYSTYWRNTSLLWRPSQTPDVWCCICCMATFGYCQKYFQCQKWCQSSWRRFFFVNGEAKNLQCFTNTNTINANL